jgi:hypothetical protein
MWPILIVGLAEPSTAVKVEGINYCGDTLLFAGAILALARHAAYLDCWAGGHVAIIFRPTGGVWVNERNGLVTSVNKISARLSLARATRKVTEVHDLFLFMAFHKAMLE